MNKYINAPICESCWVARRGKPLPDGSIEVPIPVRIKDCGQEECHFCHFPTWCGIFVRAEATEEEFKAYCERQTEVQTPPSSPET